MATPKMPSLEELKLIEHEPQLPTVVIDGIPYKWLRETTIRKNWPDRADAIIAEALGRKAIEEAKARLTETDYWVIKALETGIPMTERKKAHRMALRLIAQREKK